MQETTNEVETVTIPLQIYMELMKNDFVLLEAGVGNGNVTLESSVRTNANNMTKPTLADEVKKLSELKKAYDDAVGGFSFAAIQFEVQECALYYLLYSALVAVKNSEKSLYFLGWDTFGEEDTAYLKHVRWFSDEYVTMEEMEFVAKQNGFKVESVDLEYDYDYELEEGEKAHTVKALKITWGE